MNTNLQSWKDNWMKTIQIVGIAALLGAGAFGCQQDELPQTAPVSADAAGASGADAARVGTPPINDPRNQDPVTDPDPVADPEDLLEVPAFFGQPCTKDSDCGSKGARCFTGGDPEAEGWCSMVCLEGCPNGYKCIEVKDPQLGKVPLCLNTEPEDITCATCTTDEDCVYAGARCVEIGHDNGVADYRCATACKTDGTDACTAGNICKAYEFADGVRQQCVPDTSSCICRGINAEGNEVNGSTRPCSFQNEHGTCGGVETCEGGLGWGGCSADVPGVELCDGKDNNCDGQADESVGPGACNNTNTYGSCAGTKICEGAKGWRCDAPDPAAELCDGLDNDCDGEIDEGHPDLDADGQCNLIDDDDDADGLPDAEDNCPLAANTDQKDTDYDGIGDACEDDCDADGVLDAKDNCVCQTNVGQADMDNDGLGDVCDTDMDGDASLNVDDCQPKDGSVYPGATEACNGKDDDCDANVDEGFPDTDMDSMANCVDPDNDNDGDPDVVDCAPHDPAVNSAAMEVCDGIDNDCDTLTDEGFEDYDEDGIASCVDPDVDGDGVLNLDDNCGQAFNPDQINSDDDAYGDECDPDDDNDGDLDPSDCAPLDPALSHLKTELCDGIDNDCDSLIDEGFADLDGDQLADCVDPDLDGDGVLNGNDNCPATVNPNQSNLDNDGIGNVCDLDDDADGVPDSIDNCPLAANPKQLNMDSDEWGNACDTDKDGDKVTCVSETDCQDCNDLDPLVMPGLAELCDNKDNNCDGVVDDGFVDTDGDALANCLDTDDDNDGDLDETDCEPLDETIHAGASELCDGIDQNCNDLVDEEIGDTDKDGIADCVDPDDDGDEIEDALDNCPLTPNHDQINTDADALGNACDVDDDNDSVKDTVDNCSLHANAAQVNTDADEQGDACDDDDDADQVIDADDNCPLIANGEQADNDEDEVGDVCDDDDDNDEVLDKADNCQFAVNPAQTNTDQDLLGDVCDTDDDNDGVPDVEDNCPLVANHTQINTDGNSGSGDALGDACDTDDDGDFVLDVVDNCPLVSNADQNNTDGDALGDACDGDKDNDGDKDITDCQPSNPAIHHQAVESCNGIDDDCDGSVDEQGSVGCAIYYVDVDGDQKGASDFSCLCKPQGVYTATVAGDCDDTNKAIHPGASETCNGIDDNCDNVLDPEGVPGCQAYFLDADGDEYGSTLSKCLCAATQAYSATVAGDCNDSDASVFPGAPESCNGKDDNCDLVADPEGMPGCSVFYRDQDGDTIGSEEHKCLCAPDGPFSAVTSGDCNDSDKTTYPGALETCNGKDDNCDEITDPENTYGCGDYFVDKDLDGYGGDASKCLCKSIAPFTALQPGDCADDNAAVKPGAAEICNGKDDNCDNVVDSENSAGCTAFYLDADGDNVGSDVTKCLCQAMGQYDAKIAGDCNDSDWAVYPGAPELCNGKDDNCDELVDPAGSDGCLDWHMDQDGDGAGSKATKCLCHATAPYTATKDTDCADNDATVFPGAPELCNGKDDNCDQETDPENTFGCQTYFLDADNDGIGTADTRCLCKAEGKHTATKPGDCSDEDDGVFPGAVESCNGKDDNCDQITDPEGAAGCESYYLDADGDGHGINVSKCLCGETSQFTAAGGGDCNDSDLSAFPGAEEICNGKDDDCDTAVDEGCP